MSDLTPSEAAKVIGCHLRYVRMLIRQGKLQAKKIRPTKLTWRWSITYCEALRYRNCHNDGRGWPRGKPRNSKGTK